MATYLAVSATEAATRALLEDGPRRDFIELARVTEGEIVYRPEGHARKGWAGKVLGQHVKQAWRLSARLEEEDIIFADGEHVALPLCAFLALRRKRSVAVVALVHFADRWWKRAGFRIASRLLKRGTMVCHSALQRDMVARAVGRRWRVDLLPYQADTGYWSSSSPRPRSPARILAVGSEHRDYQCLARAVEGLEAEVVVAAGSHWARSIEGVSAAPPNMTYMAEALPFSKLREQYEQATVVVVPLQDVTNQSGITVMLEAMSMQRPVVVTATRGQRECVRGPLVRRDGCFDHEATGDRGPQVFNGGPGAAEDTGLYCVTNDADSLRHALSWLIERPEDADRLGRAARDSCVSHFSLEGYVERLAALIGAPAGPVATGDLSPVEAQ